MSEFWTRDKIMKLIELYHNKECLWKTTNNCYTNKAVRNKAWEDISTALGCEIRSAERKMKTLRTQLNCNYKRCEAKEKSTDDSFQRKWFAYDALSFLIKEKLPQGSNDKFDSNKETSESDDLLKSEERDLNIHYTDKYEDDKESEPSEMSYQTILNHTHVISNNNQQENDDDNDSDQQNESNKLQKNIIGKSSENYFYVEQAQIYMKPVDEQRDQYTIYAEHIACRLRNIKDSHLQLQIQNQINNILYEAEIKELTD